MTADIFDELGYLAIASRMKRISDYLYDEVAQIYHQSGLDLDSRFFPVISALSRYKEISVQELAQHLGLTHAAVSILAKALVGKKMVISTSDPADRRRTLLSLSPSTRATIRKADPIWKEIEGILREYGSTSKGDLLATITEFESCLVKKGIPIRNANSLHPQKDTAITIVDYQDSYRKDFEKINKEWLVESGFDIEPIDVRYFNDPSKMIIEKGGAILFSQVKNKNVGTCALRPINKRDIELLKMGVLKSARGKGIGTFLLKNALDRARKLGFKCVILETHSSLRSARSLYEAFGFKKIPMDSSEYARVDMKMKLRL